MNEIEQTIDRLNQMTITNISTTHTKVIAVPKRPSQTRRGNRHTINQMSLSPTNENHDVFHRLKHCMTKDDDLFLCHDEDDVSVDRVIDDEENDDDLLFGNGSKCVFDPFVVDKEKMNELMKASSRGDFHCVAKCLKMASKYHLDSIDSSFVDFQNLKGETALFLAVNSGCEKCVHLLLNQGKADPSIGNLEGITPLHAAASIDNINMVSLLIRSGADICAKDEVGDTPLHWAVREKAERSAKAMVRADPSILYVRNDDDETAIDLAIEIGETELATTLGMISCDGPLSTPPLSPQMSPFLSPMYTPRPSHMLL